MYTAVRLAASFEGQQTFLIDFFPKMSKNRFPLPLQTLPKTIDLFATAIKVNWV